MRTINFPCGTPDVLRFLGIHEHEPNNAIRQGKVQAPTTIRGRRFWAASDVAALADALAVKLTPAKRRALKAAAEQEVGARV